LQDLTDEERKEEMPNLMKMISEKGKDLQTQVDKILDAKQTARIKELSIQRRNVAALQDDEVVAALKLSDEQKEKLTAIRDSTAKEQEEIVKGLLSGGGDRSQIRTKMEALQKTVGEKSFAVLTPEQREQFEKMKGAKFNFPPQGRGPGF
jgi:Spy/CpxP family protein refolding chaperone